MSGDGHNAAVDHSGGGEVQQAHCDRCGTVGEHIICIKANREGGLENWKPLCDSCLKELGEWFRQSLQSGGDEA